MCSARLGRERRHRAWWRHEQFAIRCAATSATHHSANRSRRVDAETQTIQVVFPQERESERTVEQIIDVPVPQARRRRTGKRVAPTPAVTYAEPESVSEYLAPSFTGTCAAPVPLTECAATEPAVTDAAPVPASEYVAPARAVTSAIQSSSDRTRTKLTCGTRSNRACVHLICGSFSSCSLCGCSACQGRSPLGGIAGGGCPCTA